VLDLLGNGLRKIKERTGGMSRNAWIKQIMIYEEGMKVIAYIP
jgi:hypothetical protein